VSNEEQGCALVDQDRTDKRPKALALLSGGLDSLLAVKMVLDQGIEVEAVNFVTPFCLCDRCSVSHFGAKLGIKIHRVFLGQEFLDMVASPTYGYGSQMNPCLDCRILMFKKAKGLAERIGADFLVTGEVLGERPFSQRKESMLKIEREAGVEGKVLRPLSAMLLSESEPERRRLVRRDMLLGVRGRRRAPQMELARKLGIAEYPNPSGGCLLTDPRFADRLREHLKHEDTLTLKDVALLKCGRHFRIDGVKVIVGRNEQENNRLLMIAEKSGIPYLKTVDHEGPLTLITGKDSQNVLKKAAAITARYSDAPKDAPARVAFKDKEEQILEIEAIKDEELEPLRV